MTEEEKSIYNEENERKNKKTAPARPRPALR